MPLAEFEERSYEAPLYNQLERGNVDVFTPGQVLENTVGFDRGLLLTEAALWETLGYEAPLRGAALAYYDWPFGWGPRQPRVRLPRFRLNLFLQSKRPFFHRRAPRQLRGRFMFPPMWSFKIAENQQRLLETLAQRTERRAHVAYACAAFHTNSDLFVHTKRRTIVQNSTFPSAMALSKHETWYFDTPGASGVANPDVEDINEQPLLERIRSLAREGLSDEGGNLAWLDALAERVVQAVADTELPAGATDAQFFDDLQTLGRLAEMYQLRPSFHAYAQVRLFAERFDLSWLIVGDAA